MTNRAEPDGCPDGPPLLSHSFAEQFVVWAARVWVEGMKRGGEAPLLDRAFVAAGALEALRHHHGLFVTLATAAVRSIDIRCVPCRHTSPDELRLIRLTGAFQAGRIGEGAMLVSRWLPPAATRVAVDQALGYAMALARADLRIGPGLGDDLIVAQSVWDRPLTASAVLH